MAVIQFIQGHTTGGLRKTSFTSGKCQVLNTNSATIQCMRWLLCAKRPIDHALHSQTRHGESSNKVGRPTQVGLHSAEHSSTAVGSDYFLKILSIGTENVAPATSVPGL